MTAIDLPGAGNGSSGAGSEGAGPWPLHPPRPPRSARSSRRRSGARAPKPTALYVALDLRQWETNEPELYARDIAIDRTPFRRLDPEFYAWIKFTLTWAMGALHSGRIDAAKFEEISRRFSAVYVWARERFGEEALGRAEDGFDPQKYSPPPTSTRSKHFVRPPRRGRDGKQ